MPEFVIYLHGTASASYTIKADDIEEAELLAEDIEAPVLCAQCSGWGRDYDLDLGDEWETEIVAR